MEKYRKNKLRIIGIVLVLVLVYGEISSHMAQVIAASPQVVVTNPLSLTAVAFSKGEGEDAVNVDLKWGNNAAVYRLYRTNIVEDIGGKGLLVYEGTSKGFQEYDLGIGTWYYTLETENTFGELSSKTIAVETTKLPKDMYYFDNMTGSQVPNWNPIVVDGVYYNYRTTRIDDGLQLDEYTSDDGTNYQFNRTVIEQSAHENLYDCKLEAFNLRFIKETNQVVIWAHWEYQSGYASGKGFVASGTPGGDFNLQHIYNPLGYQVRDMDFFIDDDRTGYLVAASNRVGEGANSTIRIFKMNETYTDVVEVTNVLFEGKHREAPSLIKKDGYYYLFTSQSAGWYPSNGAYASATSLDGEFTELREIGNTSTFSCQSGGLAVLGNGQDTSYIMTANRWIRGDGTSGQHWLPITMDEGFAYYDYWTGIYYNPHTGRVIPVQDGELISFEKTTQSSVSGKTGSEADKANDGNYMSSFTASEAQWPFTWQVDLGKNYNLSNIQLSWFIYKGSEAYYKYKVEASLDGKTWVTVLDKTDESDTKVSKTYGFNVDDVSGIGRYIRIYVENAVLQNSPNNWYTPTLYEAKIFGEKASDMQALQALYNQYKETQREYYTEDSYQLFEKTMLEAKTLLDNPDVSDENFTKVFGQLIEVISNLVTSDSLPVEVIGEVERQVVLVGEVPDMPPTVQVRTKGNDTVKTTVEWEAVTEDRFSEIYDMVTVNGSIPGTDLTVQAFIEVIPRELIYFIDSGTNNDGQSPSHMAVLHSGLAPELKNTDFSDPKSGSVGTVWQRSVGHVTVNPNSQDKYLSGTGGNSSPISYKVTLDPGIYDVTAAGAYYTGVQGKTANGVKLTAEGASIEGDVIAVPAGSSATGKLIVETEGMITLNMTGYTNGATAGVTFIGISKHQEQNMVPESSLKTPATVENVEGTLFLMQIVVNQLEHDAKLLEFVMNIPSCFEVKEVSVNSNVTGGSLAWNVESSEKNILRATYTNLHHYSNINTTDEENFALFDISLELKELLDEGSVVSVGLKELNQYLDARTWVSYADGTKTAQIRLEGTKIPEVTVTELYTGDGIDIIPADKKAIKAEFIGLSDRIKESICYVTKTCTEPLYYSQDFSGKTGKPTYIFLVDKSTNLENLTFIENYKISDNPAEEVKFGDTNYDGYIDAQDALNEVSLWVRYVKPEITSKLIIIYNVNGDSRINNADALRIVEYFIKNSNWPVLQR